MHFDSQECFYFLVLLTNDSIDYQTGRSQLLWKQKLSVDVENLGENMKNFQLDELVKCINQSTN